MIEDSSFQTGRPTKYTGIRLFVDQIIDLKDLAHTKHRHQLTVSDLIRIAIDMYLDQQRREAKARE
jgi:hypothetical protein